ncbi:HNH endonuclease family protein [Metabacillus litoralis]|uniref:HNH endonuclease family protein n=1 Tax=Metabacillus litoralis TaxID=152268 RepID=UPI0021F5C696|nr:HNH endonuclease family protein [Metabacillus litoralis]
MKNFTDEEQRNKSVRKIGNITVLLNRLNSRIKNSDFSNKKSAYLESAIPQNKILGNQPEWKNI